MILTSTQKDRAGGVLLGQAIGDALGVPYEFASPIPFGTAEMIGGGLGPYAPGEWSDDTQMAVCIARATASSWTAGPPRRRCSRWKVGRRRSPSGRPGFEPISPDSPA